MEASVKILFLISLFILIKLSESRVITETIEINVDEGTERCRNKCVYKFLIHEPNSFDCLKNPNCLMCWDYCRVISYANTELANSMCGDEYLCFDGCKVACIYHKIKSVNRLRKILKNSV